MCRRRREGRWLWSVRRWDTPSVSDKGQQLHSLDETPGIRLGDFPRDTTVNLIVHAWQCVPSAKAVPAKPCTPTTCCPLAHVSHNTPSPAFVFLSLAQLSTRPARGGGKGEGGEGSLAGGRGGFCVRIQSIVQHRGSPESLSFQAFGFSNL